MRRDTEGTLELDTTRSLTQIGPCLRSENFSSSSVSQLLFSESFCGPASARDFWANFLATFGSNVETRFFISQSSPASLSASCWVWSSLFFAGRGDWPQSPVLHSPRDSGFSPEEVIGKSRRAASPLPALSASDSPTRFRRRSRQRCHDHRTSSWHPRTDIEAPVCPHRWQNTVSLVQRILRLRWSDNARAHLFCCRHSLFPRQSAWRKRPHACNGWNSELLRLDERRIQNSTTASCHSRRPTRNHAIYRLQKNRCGHWSLISR